jgi:type IV secretion system protein VirB8
MNEQSREKLDTYFAEAASWNQDRNEAMRTSTRIAWRVAAGASLIALLEAVALVLLTPLKTVEPYTLMVDRTTGYVQALRPLNQAMVSPDAALTQSFLAQYVMAREEYDIATLSTDYRKVALLSSGNARADYLHQMQASNPASPLNSWPRTTIIQAEIKSVSPLSANTALVRFNTLRTDQGGQPQVAGAWVAVVRYRYSNAPMKLQDRMVNPLGFQVTGYRKDPEAIPTVAITRPTASATVSGPLSTITGGVVPNKVLGE